MWGRRKQQGHVEHVEFVTSVDGGRMPVRCACHRDADHDRPTSGVLAAAGSAVDAYAFAA
ncbi:hypothetical protein ESP57_08525 [Agromyces fucosus]|uniref:Uncharacterized protein n=1 Tax=Agromyces fucosus TaxID=41985 RepID=A0A4Q2JRG3_9MICO|nr:hypothetical protein [Agromyces fucosus]RXZ48997.1 hypothetical protein ESP57_08525 [Agromyces fucosus]